MSTPTFSWQPSLLEAGRPAVDDSYRTLTRVALDEASWVDHAPGWVGGADELFADLVATVPWRQRERWMYGRLLPEPRLTARWAAGGAGVAIVDDICRSLSQRYGVVFDTVGLNLYRDGKDSVAWHADRIPAEIAEPIVALVSLGDSRPFRLRPLDRSGAHPPARTFHLGRGDLLVTGGLSQRQWQHSVPKVARAGPRISLAFRHGVHYD